MRYSSFVTSALALAGFSNGLNILLNNDDGFGSGNLRELYKLLKAAGHNGTSSSCPLPPITRH
jgi:5'-nucleotidase